MLEERFLADEFLAAVSPTYLELGERTFAVLNNGTGPTYEMLGRSAKYDGGWDALYVPLPEP